LTKTQRRFLTPPSIIITFIISVLGMEYAQAETVVSSAISTAGVVPTKASLPVTTAKVDAKSPTQLRSAPDETAKLNAVPTIVSSSCMTCHGQQGITAPGVMFPNLAGQWAFYLRTQLYDFKSHQRADPMAAIMWGMVAPLTDAQIHQVATYFSNQVRNPGVSENPKLVQAGKKIYKGGLLKEDVPACMACHGPTGVGIPPLFPALAGQRQGYVVNQLNYFKLGTRTDDPDGVMRDIAKNLTSQQIMELAAYVRAL